MYNDELMMHSPIFVTRNKAVAAMPEPNISLNGLHVPCDCHVTFAVEMWSDASHIREVVDIAIILKQTLAKFLQIVCC